MVFTPIYLTRRHLSILPGDGAKIESSKKLVIQIQSIGHIYRKTYQVKFQCMQNILMCRLTHLCLTSEQQSIQAKKVRTCEWEVEEINKSSV